MRRPASAVAMLVASLSVVGALHPVSAWAAPAFELPFPCGEVWGAMTYAGHGEYAVDWNLVGGGTTDHGRSVVASAAGVARLHSQSYGYGNYVVVDHGDGWSTLYAHLSAFSVGEGRYVAAGDEVGKVGNTGGSDGAHLHYEQAHDGHRVPVVIHGEPLTYGHSGSGSEVEHESHNCNATQLPIVSVRDATVAEGDATASVEVDLSVPAWRPMTVEWYVVDASARSPGDYEGVTGTATFAPGDTAASVTVPIHDDRTDEGHETLVLRLGSVTNGMVGDGAAAVTIVDDDTHRGRDRDLDGDGVTVAAGDCVDRDRRIHAGTGEVPRNHVDDDCDVLTRDDRDGAIRISGPARVETAIAVSHASFGSGDAGAVVLARADELADALAAAPLAVAERAPILLTPSGWLDPATAGEIARVLPLGATVYLLGGPSAISPSVADELVALGYRARRLGGATRVETSLAIAHALGDPGTVLLTTAYASPDALVAGAAAAHEQGAVLLTTGEVPHPAVESYLDAHPSVRYAIGGPAARAYPQATSIAGPSRDETAVAVASWFFDDPVVVGIAGRDASSDALVGSAHVAALGGPVLLVGHASMHPRVIGYLCAESASLGAAFVYGGRSVVADATGAGAGALVRGRGCG